MSKGALAEGIFKGETINTPSMLAVEDVIFALEWAKSVGGLQGLMARSDANAAALGDIVEAEPARRGSGRHYAHALSSVFGAACAEAMRVKAGMPIGFLISTSCMMSRATGPAAFDVFGDDDLVA